MLLLDVQAGYDGDPAADSREQIIFSYPGFYAIFVYRIAHELYNMKVPFIPRIMTEHAHSVTGIDIHPGATIGKGLVIDHGAGVVIGETAEIGDNCTIYQGVTLGGTGKEQGKRHPTIMENVTLSAGAKVLGGFTVGQGAKIGAGAVVLKEVPPYATVVGVPGRVVRIRPPETEDATHTGIVARTALSLEAKEEMAKEAARIAEEKRNEKK